jgi:hypothetical protein
MTFTRTIAPLYKPVAIEPLVTFRILFGALMMFSTLRFMVLGWVDTHYVQPLFHFKYYGFAWVEALPPTWMYVVHVVMMFAAAGVMLGFYYRLSALLLFLTFTYTQLIDLTYYLNHYYFVSLVSAVLVLLPANRSFSLDVSLGRANRQDTVPQWTIFLIRFQLAVVYFYAGIAKINYDWLIEALPLKIWMPAQNATPLIGPLLALPVVAYLFSWFGMLYDVTIVYWLSNRKTRLWAYGTVIFFHGITGLMFQIGVFPLVMIASTLIFFSEEWHRKTIGILRKITETLCSVPTLATSAETTPQFKPKRLLTFSIALFVLFQVLFPWRYVLYPGNLFWTEEGYRFSWRVMLMEKAGTATFYVKDGKTGREGIVVNSEFLNAHQEKQMSMQPDMILQFAHFLKGWYAKHGIQDPEVRAEVYVTLNARPSRLLLDPSVNLASIEDGWKTKKWITPYQE